MFALPRTCPVSKPQMVQVVSMEEVPRMLGSTSFQSKDVNGAQKSEFLLLFRRHSNLGVKRRRDAMDETLWNRMK